MGEHRLGIVAIAMVSAALSAAAPAASAACRSSTTETVSHTDASGDNEGPAPDVTTATAAVDSACVLTLVYEVANREVLGEADQLNWFIDVDDDRATGDPAGRYRGADYAVSLLDGGMAGILKYVRATDSFEPHKPARPFGPFGTRLDLADLPAASADTTFRIAGGSSHAATDGTYTFDRVPDIDEPPVGLRVRFDDGRSAAGCVVPRLRGLPLPRARVRIRAARCRVGAIRRKTSRRLAGRVLRTVPRAGTQLRRGARVKIVLGVAPGARR